MAVLMPINLPTSCMDCPCGHYNPMLFSVTCAVSMTVMSEDEAKQGRADYCQMREIGNSKADTKLLEESGFEL